MSGRRARADVAPELPGIEHADPAASDAATYDHRDAPPQAPEHDRWTRELPLAKPKAGVSADFVGELTQI